MQNFTSVILYMNSICIAQLLSGANFQILYCSSTFTLRQKLFKTIKHFQAITCRFFYREIMTSFLSYITAMLRALFVWHGSLSLPSVCPIELLQTKCVTGILHLSIMSLIRFVVSI